MTAQAARKPRVYIETVSILCPVCEEDVENPEPGMGHVFNQAEFERLPQVFKCQCGAAIKKPRTPW